MWRDLPFRVQVWAKYGGIYRLTAIYGPKVADVPVRSHILAKCGRINRLETLTGRNVAVITFQ